MINVIILVLILIGLTVHRYLSTFWEQGNIPYPNGFIFFANLFAFVYLMNFIFMFGIVAGTIIALLCYFQIVYSSVLWIFSIPSLINMHKSINLFKTPRVNPIIYGSFSFLVILIAILCAVNIFIFPYKSMWLLIGESIWNTILVSIIIVVVGNIIRMIVMSYFLRKE